MSANIKQTDSNGRLQQIWIFLQAMFNTINHILIGAVSLYMTWLCWSTGNSKISQHALLCTIGVNKAFNYFKFNQISVISF